MILGQIKDLEAENSPAVTLEQLKEVHLYKTGCLFTAPLVMGAILAGQDAAISQWRRIGALMGLAFQVQDRYPGRHQEQQGAGKISQRSG